MQTAINLFAIMSGLIVLGAVGLAVAYVAFMSGRPY